INPAEWKCNRHTNCGDHLRKKVAGTLRLPFAALPRHAERAGYLAELGYRGRGQDTKKQRGEPLLVSPSLSLLQSWACSAAPASRPPSVVREPEQTPHRLRRHSQQKHTFSPLYSRNFFSIAPASSSLCGTTPSASPPFRRASSYAFAFCSVI